VPLCWDDSGSYASGKPHNQGNPPCGTKPKIIQIDSIVLKINIGILFNLFKDRFMRVLKTHATELTATLSIVVAISGVMMFFHFYKGRVQFMHEWLGMAFVLAAMMHAVRHYRPITALFSNARTRVFLGAVALISAGFLLMAPASKPNPEKALSRLLLKARVQNVAPLIGLTNEALLLKLRDAGVANGDADKSIEEMARESRVDPMQLLLAIAGQDKKNQ